MKITKVVCSAGVAWRAAVQVCRVLLVAYRSLWQIYYLTGNYSSFGKGCFVYIINILYAVN